MLNASLSVKRSTPFRNVLQTWLLLLSVTVIPSGAALGQATLQARAASGTKLVVADQNEGLQTLMRASGAAEKLSSTITYANFLGGPAILEAFRAGALDLATVGNTPPIQAHAAGEQIPIVAARTSSEADYFFAVRPGLKIDTLEQLRGKSIAYGEGTGRQPFVLNALKLAGLTRKDVRLVPLRASDFPDAIRSGQIDVASLGRQPDQIVILPGISAAIGSTEAEAQRVWEELNELAHPSVGLSRLSNRFGGHDFSHLKLDQVLSADDFPDPSQVEASRSRAQLITAYVARERPTLRRLLHSLAGARGHFTATGTPEQIADIIEDWFVSGAADGFNVMPPILPTQFAVFTEEVVPLLRKRGLFRSEYRDDTLRDRLGLDPVPSRFDSPKQQQRSA